MLAVFSIFFFWIAVSKTESFGKKLLKQVWFCVTYLY